MNLPTATFFVALLIAIVLATIILVRCCCVAAKISRKKFVSEHTVLKWVGFQMSYLILAGAALHSVLYIMRTGGTLPVWAFLIATAGIVVFDPRRPTRRTM